MNSLLIAPILLPMFLGCLLLMPMGLRAKRALLVLGTALQLPIAISLMQMASTGELFVYAMGDWAAPFGIVLMLDRLSSLMLMLVAGLSIFCAIYAIRGDDERGVFFHPLFAFQLMGLNGAFLTGDMFNLFVFFEILLLASYALLLHGVGEERTRAGLHYVTINLVGSSVFLLGLGILYGVSGTLNMADLSIKAAQATPDQQVLYRLGAILLLVVFGIKAAMMPLYLWLPRAYASASAPVAALFAVMTKLGVYSMIRVFSLVFESGTGGTNEYVFSWLWPLAVLTIVLGALGALSAKTLKMLVAYLVVVSAGTLQAAVAMHSEAALAAGLYYLLHSTAAAGALFLLADLIGRQRGEKQTTLISGPPLRNAELLGGLFFINAIAIAGLPPLSGFIGKVGILLSAPQGFDKAALWFVLLLGGLSAIVGLSRAGSTLIWRVKDKPPTSMPLDKTRLFATIGLVLIGPALALLAEPVFVFVHATAEQLMDVELYHALVVAIGGDR